MRHIISFGALVVLVGCSNYSEKFECGSGPGVGCKSLTHVNNLVEVGDLPFDMDELHKSAHKAERLVTPERNSFKMWVASYRDESGYYHEPSYVRIGDQHE